METTMVTHEADEERFRKLQQFDQAAFNEKLDSLAVSKNSWNVYVKFTSPRYNNYLYLVRLGWENRQLY